MLVFIVVGLVFNWFELNKVFKNNDVVETGNDMSMAQFNIESVYQQIKNNRNPFVFDKQQLYPYTINISLSDPGVSNLGLYAPLRRWFTEAQAIPLIMIINTFFASCLMYFFLRRVKVKIGLSVLLAIVYAYTSIIPFKYLGHYTYTAVYLFPLGGLLFLKWSEAKHKLETIGWTSLIGLYGAYVILLNFYYFVGITIVGGIIALYQFISRQMTRDRWKQIGLSVPIVGIIMLALLRPWLLAVKQFAVMDSRTPTAGFAGATELSGDLIGIFLPTRNHFWYQGLSKLIPPDTQYVRYWQGLVEQNSNHSIYPGLLVIIGILVLVLNRKKLAQKVRVRMAPFMWSGIVFCLLLLGPFLKIASRIAINLEGVSVVFPLPFLILHYLPGMASLRAPTRFFPLAMFFVVIILGIGLTELLKNHKKFGWKKWGVVLIILLMAEMYTVPTQTKTRALPSEQYKVMAQDQIHGTVLEIPFTVRDGFQYLGEKDAISFQNGSLDYQRPVLGGYFSRLHPDIFAYYHDLYFVGKILDLLDTKANYLNSLDIEQVEKELDFLDVRYILLRKNETYTTFIQTVLTKLSAKLISSGEDYVLYQREIGDNNFDKVKLGEKDDYLYVAQGMGPREDGYRAIVQQKAKLFWKTNIETDVLSLSAESTKARMVKIYLGEILLGEMEITPEKKVYQWELENKLDGMQILTLVVENLEPGESMDSQTGIKIYEYGSL